MSLPRGAAVVLGLALLTGCSGEPSSPSAPSAPSTPAGAAPTASERPEPPAQRPAARPDSPVTVCVGTSAEHAAGQRVQVRVVSRDTVLAEAEVQVPGQTVLLVPSTADAPRLLVDGEQWASAPRGGGWSYGRGEGCPAP